jgi:hypothetical protein
MSAVTTRITTLTCSACHGCYKQGWKVMHGDESLIHIKNRKGGVINFKIAVPTKKWAVCACRFVHAIVFASMSIEVGIKVSVITAHCLL